ncbi:MAG TPA: hypothetical protein VHE35_11360 [Kofleriaceae bacterium]|nr:hypothetical protein [Kofleriaceae bacterium]
MVRPSNAWSDDPDVAPAATSPRAHLVAVRFGEFLRDCELINDEQWLAALAAHWSEEPRRRIGDIVVAHGYLTAEVVERAASQFHEGLDVVEVR